MQHTIPCVLVLGLLTGAREDASACSQLPAPTEWTQTGSAQDDQTVPTIAGATATIRRNAPIDDPSNSCFGVDFSAIEVDIDAADDRTPAAELGFQFVVVAGTAPTLLPPSPVIGAGPTGWFSYPIEWDEPIGIDFTLELRAIDASGNRSQPFQLVVRDEPGATLPAAGSHDHSPADALGCSAGGKPASAGWAIGVLVMLTVARRRQRASAAR